MAQAADRLTRGRAIADGAEVPAVSEETREAERAVQALAETAAAAEAGLAETQAQHRKAIDAVSVAIAARASAELDVVLEDSLEVIESELVPAITALRDVEAKLGGVLTDLQRRTDGGDLLAARTRERLMTAIWSGRQCRGCLGCRPMDKNPNPFRRLSRSRRLQIPQRRFGWAGPLAASLPAPVLRATIGGIVWRASARRSRPFWHRITKNASKTGPLVPLCGWPAPAPSAV